MLLLGVLCGLAVQPLFAASPAQLAANVSSAVNTPQAGSPRPTPTQDNSPRGQMMRGVVSQTRHFLGDESAPVTLIEFCDFALPECAQFANQAYIELKVAYIDTGMVRFGFWPMATLDESSQLTAEAAECAAEQTAFWQFYQSIFIDQASTSLTLDRPGLETFAADLGLDTAAVSECLDSGKYTDVIKNGTITIQDLGLPDVPSFIINGQVLIGLQSYETLQQTIDSLLANTLP
jgi:protein-disulfide isomerase